MKNKRKILLFLIINLVIILVTIFSLQTTQSSKLAEVLGIVENFATVTEKWNSEIERVEVQRVVDGDTIVLQDGRTLRYLNIDTPESVKPNTPVQCYAKEASAMNKALVNQKTIYIKYDQEETDRYGRELRFIFLKSEDINKIDRSVNAYLVEMGFARASIYQPNDTYAQTFYQLERQARENNVGIWKNCPKPFEE